MDNIVLLNSFIDFDLYAVSGDPTMTQNTVKNKTSSIINLYGSNQKETLIVYSYIKGQKNLSEVHFELLKKIFGAIKYDLEKDVSSLGITPETQISFEKLTEKGNYKFVVCFGPGADVLGLNQKVSKYTPTAIAGATMIFADTIGEIAADKSKKMSLWRCLQATFLK